MILDIIVCLGVVFFGINIKNNFKIFDSYEKKLLNKLFFYHLAFSVIFYFYIMNFGGDAYSYWYNPKNYSFTQLWSLYLSQGGPNEMMYLINFIPSNLLGLSFFTSNILFGLFGFLSFVYFLAILKKIMPHYKSLNSIKVLGFKIFPLILFLPNLHFWSSGVGKDTLLFFVILLFAYSLLEFKKRVFGLLISLTLSFLVRPHITLFLLTGFGLGIIFGGKLKGFQKTFLAVLFTGIFIIVFSSVLDFVKIEEVSVDSVEQFSDNKAKVLAAKGGSVVDISNYPYPLKVFTFLYRPLFFDINNPLAAIASFENLFLLILSLKFIFNKPIKWLKKSNYIIKGAFVFFILGSLSFSLILGNLGIMLRQKNMFMLLFYLFIFWNLYSRLIIPKLKNNHGY